MRKERAGKREQHSQGSLQEGQKWISRANKPRESVPLLTTAGSQVRRGALSGELKGENKILKPPQEKNGVLNPKGGGNNNPFLGRRCLIVTLLKFRSRGPIKEAQMTPAS